jgi:hypothetical protein
MGRPNLAKVFFAEPHERRRGGKVRGAKGERTGICGKAYRENEPDGPYEIPAEPL